MPRFTIIGVYEDTGESWFDYSDGDDAHEAMRNAAEYMQRCGEAGVLTIVGAIHGEHEITPPCEDSEKTAAAVWGGLRGENQGQGRQRLEGASPKQMTLTRRPRATRRAFE